MPSLMCRQAKAGLVADLPAVVLELPAPALVHWGLDDWQQPTDTKTRESGLGTHVADLDISNLGPGRAVVFTFLWQQDNRWDDNRFTVQLVSE